jgi:mRNA interferase RelE/StbE
LKYELAYTRRDEKDIRKLDAVVRKRVGKALLQYRTDPLKYAEKLTDTALGTYRFRVGDFRVAFDIEGNEIVVLRVGHRREIYRRSTS